MISFMLMFGIPAGMPGMTTSPGFMPGLHGPTHFASMTVVASCMPIIGGLYFDLISPR